MRTHMSRPTHLCAYFLGIGPHFSAGGGRRSWRLVGRGAHPPEAAPLRQPERFLQRPRPPARAAPLAGAAHTGGLAVLAAAHQRVGAGGVHMAVLFTETKFICPCPHH